MASKKPTPKSETGLVKQESLAAVDIPDYLQGTAGMGNENVTSKDITLPRLAVIQDLSPQLNSQNPKFDPECERGDVINSLTGDIICHMGESFKCVDLAFQKVFGIFKGRKHGGGFKGQASTEKEAKDMVAGMEDSALLEIVETDIHVCILLDGDNRPLGEVGMFFKLGTMKASRDVNGLLIGRPAARFASIVEWTVYKDSNSPTQSWYALKPKLLGFVSPELFKLCKERYELVYKNQIVSVKGADDEVEATDVEY